MRACWLAIQVCVVHSHFGAVLLPAYSVCADSLVRII